MKHRIVLLMLIFFLTGSPCLGQNTVQTDEQDILTGKTATTEEMFGWRSGYIHPYFSVRGEYTDNLYNINIDETTNFLTTVSPGIWLGIPRTKEVPVRLSPYNTAVGGKRYSLPASGSFDRFQAYVLGGLDLKNYSVNSDLNYTAWGLEGLIQYSLPAGFSFRLMDRFTSDQDSFDIGSFLLQDFTVDQDDVYVSSTPSRLRKFVSNQANASLNFDMSERFSTLLDFTNFYLDYDDPVNDWLDRTDNLLSLSLSYKFSPKTSFFVEYSQAFIDYETDTGNDSEDMFVYGGINWKGSVKTSLMAKGGYQVKEYEDSVSDDSDTFTMEAWVNYLVTDKTKISFYLYKALEETDSLLNNGRDTIAGRFKYTQQFSSRIRGYCEFWYEYYDYEGFSRVDSNIPENEARQDDHFRVKPAVQYYFGDWFMAEIAYSFENRNSNYNFNDFTTQTVFLSLNASF